MRLGTTSFIYPDDIVPNVRKLAGRVQDVELIIFEADDFGNNFPGRDTINELRLIAAGHDMTYTVHLPLDLRLADPDPDLETALRVIRCTEQLSPHSFIVHLDGKSDERVSNVDQYTTNCLRCLDVLIREVGEPEKICAENLDSHHPEILDAVLAQTRVSRCVDVGHLWKQGRNAGYWVEKWLPRTRVVHLHGVAERDHKSLSLVAPSQLDPVVDLLTSQFNDVVTLEVFSESDLAESELAFRQSHQRLRG